MTQYKILVVDDNADIRELLEILLTSEGYAVTLASSGEQALQLLSPELEYQMLLLMASHAGRIFSAQNLYESVWNEPYLYSSNGTVMVHIRKLRVKLEDDPQNPKLIQTVWGKGYRFG